MKRENRMQRQLSSGRRASVRAVKNRKRLRIIPLLLILLISIMGTTLPYSNKTKSYQVRESYVVKSGDTLWSIASAYADKEDDLRLMIDRMVDANNLGENCALKPGDTIFVVVDERDLSF